MKQRKSNKVLREIINVLLLIIGSIISSFAINVLFTPNNLTMGGASGLANAIVILSNGKIPLGLMSLIINIPILLYGWYYFDFSIVYRSFIGTFVYSLAIDVGALFMGDWYDKFINGLSFTPDPLVFAIFAGIFFGLGLGLILKGRYTTGGTDILAVILADKFEHISIGQAVFFFDLIIIIFSTIVNYFNDLDNVADAILAAIYSFIALYLTGKLTDIALTDVGTDEALACYIISDKNDLISQEILTKLKRGVTILYGEGGYTSKERKVLYVVINPREIQELRNIIHDIDPEVFLIISDVKTVSGEGFTYQKDDKEPEIAKTR